MSGRAHVGYTGVVRVEEEEGDEALVFFAPVWCVLRPTIAVDVGPRVLAAGEAGRRLGVGEVGVFVVEGDVDRVVGEGVRLRLVLCSAETHSMYRETHWFVKPSMSWRMPRTSVAVLCSLSLCFGSMGRSEDIRSWKTFSGTVQESWPHPKY